MKISFSLAPLTGKKAKEGQIIKLPGLLLDSIALNAMKQEVGLVEIIDALKEYKRKIILLRSSSISDKELQVVQKAIQEELFVKSPKSFSIKNWSGNTGYQKFKNSLYDGVLMSPKAYIGIFAFLVIAFFLFTLANSILNGFKHVGKSIYDGVEKNFSAGQYGGISPVGMQNFDERDSEEKEETRGSSGQDGTSSREVIEEYNDVTIDCPAILRLWSSVYSQKPNELGFKMWDFFPEVEDQLNLYVTFESYLEEFEMLEFKELFSKAFNVEKSMSGHVELKPKAFNASQALWGLQVALTHLSVKPYDEEREGLFGIFLENYQGQINQIINKSIQNHYKVLSYLFPERVLNKVRGQVQIDEELSRQILDFATLDKNERNPNELEIKAFRVYLSEHNYFVGGDVDAEEAVGLDLLSRLPDHILFDSEKMSVERMAELRRQIPNFSWLKSADKKIHKQFLLSLTPDEATYFMSKYEGFPAFKQDLDSRTMSRMQEFKIKSSNESSIKVILGLRKKIKYFYTPVEEERENEVIQAA